MFYQGEHTHQHKPLLQKVGPISILYFSYHLFYLLLLIGVPIRKRSMSTYPLLGRNSTPNGDYQRV